MHATAGLHEHGVVALQLAHEMIERLVARVTGEDGGSRHAAALGAFEEPAFDVVSELADRHDDGELGGGCRVTDVAMKTRGVDAEFEHVADDGHAATGKLEPTDDVEGRGDRAWVRVVAVVDEREPVKRPHFETTVGRRDIGEGRRRVGERHTGCAGRRAGGERVRSSGTR